MSYKPEPKYMPILKKFHNAEVKHNRNRELYSKDPEWLEAREEYLALHPEDKIKFSKFTDLMSYFGVKSEIFEEVGNRTEWTNPIFPDVII